MPVFSFRIAQISADGYIIWQDWANTFLVHSKSFVTFANSVCPDNKLLMLAGVHSDQPNAVAASDAGHSADAVTDQLACS